MAWYTCSWNWISPIGFGWGINNAGNDAWLCEAFLQPGMHNLNIVLSKKADN